MLIRPTLAGLWFTGCQFIAVIDPHNPPEWSAAEIVEVSPVAVWPLDCGESVFIFAYSQPKSLANPNREIVMVVGQFNPCDWDMSGVLGSDDLAAAYIGIVTEGVDWNGDGGVGPQDQLDFTARFAAAISLPRDAGGCP